MSQGCRWASLQFVAIAAAFRNVTPAWPTPHASLATFERQKRAKQKQEANAVVANAATKIQAGYRVAQARRIVRMIKVRRHAAVKLESFFRRRIAWDVLQVRRSRRAAST